MENDMKSKISLVKKKVDVFREFKQQLSLDSMFSDSSARHSIKYPVHSPIKINEIRRLQNDSDRLVKFQEMTISQQKRSVDYDTRRGMSSKIIAVPPISLAELHMIAQNTNNAPAGNMDDVIDSASNCDEPSYIIPRWICETCNNQCVSIQSESRCICSHRYKAHRGNHQSNKDLIPCRSKGCQCIDFFFIFGEGSFMLRCRCKHKHLEHDCTNSKHPCKKCNKCPGFDSPWTCNCGHSWKSHLQTCQIIDSASIQDRVIKKNHFAVRQDGTLPQEGF